MRLLGALILALALAAPAQADPFGELPFRAVPGVATCLQATGVPGELVRWTDTGIELLRADAGGLTPVGSVRLGDSVGCPEVAGQPNGAAVVAAVVRENDAYVVHAALRDPCRQGIPGCDGGPRAGGAFGAPVALKVPKRGRFERLSLAVAVAPSGDALVAARQNALAKRRMHVFAFRRPAGGGFLAPQAVTAALPDIVPFALVAGADARGGFTLAWTRSGDLRRTVLETASAPPDGAFGPVARIGPAGLFSDPVLAVSPDGRALLAYGTDAAVVVAERAPGAAGFGPGIAIGGDPGRITAALGDDGAAAVAWQFAGDGIPGVQVATRAGPGAFGAAREIAPSRPFPETPEGDAAAGWTAFVGGPPLDTRTLHATVGGGAFLVAWPDEGAQVATGALAGGAATRASLGSPVRAVTSLAPVTLADGRTAIALADDDANAGGILSAPGRLQLALPDTPRPASVPPPGIDVPRLSRQRLYADESAKLPIRCSGSCDVRATAGAITYEVRSRATAGPLSLTLWHPRVVHGFAPVELTAATPGSRATRTLHVRVPVTLRREPPVPKPLDVHVKKDGHDLIVTWRTAFAARRITFAVAAFEGGTPLDSRSAAGAGKRAFRVRLAKAAHADQVIVSAFGASGQSDREARVRVR